MGEAAGMTGAEGRAGGDGDADMGIARVFYSSYTNVFKVYLFGLLGFKVFLFDYWEWRWVFK